ncbi:hypothetical protein AB0469_26200 [Streptomyces sp. NPDC093801]|uniref:hypothetical protein n=1 Tax=Streptomyces sp. NPDC093801 TaxID=3155203 RepID=UPI00344E7C11
MGMSEMGGEPAGEESGRALAGPSSGESAPRRSPSAGRRLAAGLVKVLAAEAVEAALSEWAPGWEAAAAVGVLAAVVRVALQLRRGRGGRPRS